MFYVFPYFLLINGVCHIDFKKLFWGENVMIIIFAFLLLLMCVGCRIHLKGLDENYLSMNYTQAIKGIFIIFVFLSHVRTYAEYTLASDLFVIRILDYLGQLMVAMFLFYSGYGVFESVKKKGKTYIDSFVINRIGKTFIDFSFAICLFLIVDVIVEKTYSIPHILLSFTGWTSVGNSNWYMFTIFALYLMTFICFKIGGKKRLISLILFTVCSFGYVFIMSAIHQPTRFSNTSLCYMAGMWYSYFKSEIDCFLKKHQFYYYVITLCLIGLYLYTYPFKGTRLLWFNGVSILHNIRKI